MLKKTLLTILICSMLTACNLGSLKKIMKEEGSVSNGSPSAANEKKDIQRKDPKTELILKKNSYVELNNFLTGRFYTDVLNRYFINFGTEKFAKPKSSSPFVNPVAQHEMELIDKALQYSKKEPHIQGFDEAVGDLIPKLNKLIGQFNEAHDYYKQKDYIDDSYKKGAEYHKQIISLFFDQVEPSMQVFFEQIEKLDEEQRKKNMEDLKANDIMIQYYMLDILIKARDIQSELGEQNIDSANVLKLDLAPFKKKYTSLIETIKKYKEVSEDSARIQKEGFYPAQLSEMLRNAGEVKAAATEIIDRVQKKEPVDAFDIKHGYVDSKEGTPENYSKKLARLIDYYNTSVVPYKKMN